MLVIEKLYQCARHLLFLEENHEHLNAGVNINGEGEFMLDPNNRLHARRLRRHLREHYRNYVHIHENGRKFYNNIVHIQQNTPGAEDAFEVTQADLDRASPIVDEFGLTFEDMRCTRDQLVRILAVLKKLERDNPNILARAMTENPPENLPDYIGDPNIPISPGLECLKSTEDETYGLLPTPPRLNIEYPGGGTLLQSYCTHFNVGESYLWNFAEAVLPTLGTFVISVDPACFMLFKYISMLLPTNVSSLTRLAMGPFHALPNELKGPLVINKILRSDYQQDDGIFFAVTENAPAEELEETTRQCAQLVNPNPVVLLKKLDWLAVKKLVNDIEATFP